MIWVTGDPHFGHESIIRHCERPFANVGEMDEALVKGWNKVVTRNDRVYVLGDFAFRCTRQYAQDVLDSLRGVKTLVAGNHDYKLGRHLNGWESVCDMHVIAPRSHVPVILCHYPMLSWWKSNRKSIHLHAHLHSRSTSQDAVAKRRIDMGVDSCRFMPISLDAIRAFLEC